MGPPNKRAATWYYRRVNWTKLNSLFDSPFGIYRHHKKYAEGIDTAPLVEEIKKNEAFWSATRAQKVAVQRETLNIPLLVARPTSPSIHVDNVQEVAPSPYFKDFPATLRVLERFAVGRNARISRVNIVSLTPRKPVYSHIDHGLYYAPRARYHLVVSSKGSIMTNGGQQTFFKEGEIWRYNNKVPHESYNDSDERRIHVIFDLLPNSHLGRLKNRLLWIYFNMRPYRFFKHRTVTH